MFDRCRVDIIAGYAANINYARNIIYEQIICSGGRAQRDSARARLNGIVMNGMRGATGRGVFSVAQRE